VEIISDAEGRQKAMVMADALLALPLLLMAAIQGKALRPLLAKMTGLSETRISKGNLGSLSPATQRRVSAHAREMAFQEGRRNGLSAEEVELRLAELKDLEHEPWELFAVMLMVREVHMIPHARSVGRDYGRLLSALFEDAEADRFDAFREKLHPAVTCEPFEHLGAGVTDRVERYRAEHMAASTWGGILPVFKSAVELWLFDFFAAMDAEWGRLYLGAMKPAPYFLWVAPMTDLPVGQGKVDLKSRRNIVYLPVRRLLQLSHVLMQHAYRKAWPSQPVGRSLLAIDADQTEAVVGSYFDGTKALRQEDYVAMWHAMYQRLSGNVSEADEPTPPMALLHVALLWQRFFIKRGPGSKLDAFTIMDESLYRACWQRHVDVLEDQPATETHDWPGWLVNQSLSPSST
jgi:hypothetical protein